MTASLNRKLKSLERFIIRRAGVIGKKESKPIVRALKSQIKKKRSSIGNAPRKRTGKYRKLIQARRKFSGAGKRRPDGTIPFLKIKVWTPIGNILFSKASRKYRPLKFPNQKQSIDKIKSQLIKESQDRVGKMVDQEIKSYFRGIENNIKLTF